MAEQPTQQTTVPLWAVAILVTKKDPRGVALRTIVGYWASESESKARDKAVLKAHEAYPGWVVHEAVSTQVSPATMRMALGLENST